MFSAWKIICSIFTVRIIVHRSPDPFSVKLLHCLIISVEKSITSLTGIILFSVLQELAIYKQGGTVAKKPAAASAKAAPVAKKSKPVEEEDEEEDEDDEEEEEEDESD